MGNFGMKFGQSWDNFKNLQKGSPKLLEIFGNHQSLLSQSYLCNKQIDTRLLADKKVSLPHIMS